MTFFFHLAQELWQDVTVSYFKERTLIANRSLKRVICMRSSIPVLAVSVQRTGFMFYMKEKERVLESSHDMAPIHLDVK